LPFSIYVNRFLRHIAILFNVCVFKVLKKIHSDFYNNPQSGREDESRSDRIGVGRTIGSYSIIL
ncbi:MAG TPA: hypothetical protein VK625_15305, partial [Flavitalea sp.]|nr:hypothetical protein [Flavitalea sp.]